MIDVKVSPKFYNSRYNIMCVKEVGDLFQSTFMFTNLVTFSEERKRR